jgi:hypothetical protein
MAALPPVVRVTLVSYHDRGIKTVAMLPVMQAFEQALTVAGKKLRLRKPGQVFDADGHAFTPDSLRLDLKTDMVLLVANRSEDGSRSPVLREQGSRNVVDAYRGLGSEWGRLVDLLCMPQSALSVLSGGLFEEIGPSIGMMLPDAESPTLATALRNHRWATLTQQVYLPINYPSHSRRLVFTLVLISGTWQLTNVQMFEHNRKKCEFDAVFPAILEVLPDCIVSNGFGMSPYEFGVHVKAGILKCGTRLCIPDQLVRPHPTSTPSSSPTPLSYLPLSTGLFILRDV